MKLLLQCKNCGNTMQYQTRTALLGDKSKQCVYCGKNFKIKPAIRKQLQ